MGSYTTKYKFYKPDPSENVNVDTHLNANLGIVDSSLRGQVDYEQYLTAQSGIDNTTLSKVKKGHKFYKPYSNSVIASAGSGNFPWQDKNASVPSFTKIDTFNILSTISGPWAAHPVFPPGYRLITSPGSGTTEVEFFGRIWQTGSPITSNFTFTPVLTLSVAPQAIVPATSKYFQASGGDCTSGYMTYRLIFNAATGNMDLYKMGSGVPVAGSENYVDFSGVRYSLEE
jgi:hypothetical protein